jgi:hypothetical protein
MKPKNKGEERERKRERKKRMRMIKEVVGDSWDSLDPPRP